MNKPIRVAILTLAATLLTSAAATQESELFNAHFELLLNDKTVRANPHMHSGQNVKVDFEDNLATLVIKRISDSEYELAIMVFKGKDESDRNAVVLSRTFRGVFGIPLELRGRADRVSMSGAISVTALKD